MHLISFYGDSTKTNPLNGPVQTWNSKDKEEFQKKLEEIKKEKKADKPSKN